MEEKLQLLRIEENRKEHFDCGVKAARAIAMKSKASDEAISSAAFRECRTIEMEFRAMLEDGYPSISGGRLALPIARVLQIVELRKKSLREEFIAAISDVR